MEEYIDHRNKDMKVVESEDIFRLEEMRDEIVGMIGEEVEQREKKWRYLIRGLCQVKEL